MRRPGKRQPGSAVRVFLFVLTLATASPATAQRESPPASTEGVKWGVVDAIGYGGLGFGVGLISAWDLEYGSGALVVGAASLAGTIAGAVIGRRASQTLAADGQLGAGHRVAVIGGAIMAGGTLGTLAAVPLINGEGEGTFLGSDETTVAVLAVAGGALGSLFVWRHRDELASRSVGIAPGLFGKAALGLRVRLEF